jgi:hypothetical protein
VEYVNGIKLAVARVAVKELINGGKIDSSGKEFDVVCINVMWGNGDLPFCFNFALKCVDLNLQGEI